MAPFPPLVLMCPVNTPETVCADPCARHTRHTAGTGTGVQKGTHSVGIQCARLPLSTQLPPSQPLPSRALTSGVEGAHHEQMLSRCHVGASSRPAPRTKGAQGGRHSMTTPKIRGTETWVGIWVATYSTTSSRVFLGKSTSGS